jgi:hypothetical protein
MPQQPDASNAPDVDVDDSKKYVGQLLEIDEQPSVSQWKKRDDEMSLIHKWRIFDKEDGVAVIDNNTGEAFELWQFVKDQTYHNVTTGEIAPAREIANALLNTTLTDDEVRDMIEEGWDKRLVNKRVEMDLEWYSTQKGYRRLRVLRVKPYRAPARAAAARRQPRLDDDEAD